MGQLTSPCWQKANMLRGRSGKWWQSMNHSQLGSQQGIPSLLFQRSLTLPQRTSKVSPTYCLSWDVNPPPTSVPSPPLRHKTQLCPLFLTPEVLWSQTAGHVRETYTGPPKSYGQGESVKGNSCQDSSHLYYFRNSKYPSHILREESKWDHLLESKLNREG